MPKKEIVQTTRNKALKINQDPSFFGSFAEIGAGQEVARHFFRAGLASNTVAKSISAYDKVFSDSIYGKGSRFVSRDRLIKMLDHEYVLLEERLRDRAKDTKFFTFANTVATSSHEEIPTCHGWMGFRFQGKPYGRTSEILMHVRMKDRMRLQQSECLGILGVNLMYASQHHTGSGKEFVSALVHGLSKDRFEIEYLSIDGPDLDHLDSRIMSLELVEQGLSRAVMFGEDGEPLCPADTLYGKNIFVQRGQFRPITNVNMEILEKGIKHFQKDAGCKKSECVSFLEMTMTGLKKSGKVDQQDFLDRVDTITAMGQKVLVSNFTLFADLKKYLRRLSDEYFGMVIGAATLDGIFNKKYYENYRGGMMGAFGDLFDDKCHLYVYPYKLDDICMTAGTFFPKPPLNHIYNFIRERGFIQDIENCDDVDSSIGSDKVRKLLQKGDKGWEKLVPSPVQKLIKKRKMFQ